MAANTNPIFELAPVSAPVANAAANTAKDGSGTVATLVTGDANGTRVDEIQIMSAQATRAANSAMTICIFLSVDSGTTWHLIFEVAIGAATASVSAIGATQSLQFPLGRKLKDTTHKIGFTQSVYAGVQDRMVVTAFGGTLGS